MNNLYKQVNAKLKTEAAQLEFWIVTGFIIIALLLNIFDVVRANQVVTRFDSTTSVNGMPTQSINYMGAPLTELLFHYLIIFIIYLLLCFYVAPAFESKQDKASNTAYIFLLIAACFAIDIISLNIAALVAVKILVIYFNRNKGNKQNALYYDIALLTASWMLALAGLFYMQASELKYYVLYAIPFVMTAWLLGLYWVLPQTEQTKRPRLLYTGRMLGLNIASTLLLAVISAVISHSNDSMAFINMLPIVSALFKTMNETAALLICFGNFFSQLAIMLFVRATYRKRNAKKDEEILQLQTELGQSDANLNFLKSQINPHFLFNALNTLYGTALQEDAERTGEGIQKLGDMMRFMLQENTKDKIRLSRDIDYLKNYILLQKLRTSASPAIVIETQIEDYTGNLMISPMLLIPFVENAFKHGISLQSPSHIKITLQTKDDTLYFDVHNSIHIRSDNDPEKGQSGIGLENVKQRLNLLYADRHDLLIRENAIEFFVHITLQLDSNA